MKIRSSLWLVLLCGLLVIVTACQAHSLYNSPVITPTAPNGESLYVVDGYSQANNSSAGQRIVAFQPASANAAQHITLPVGLTSLNHQRLYTATAQHGQTRISVINTQNGTNIRTFTIPGTYSTAQWGYDNALVSTNGRWLALRELGMPSGTTTIAFADTQAGKLAKTINLPGDFTLDAVSPDGSRLYLLERIANWPGHYNVMLYDLTQNQLNSSPIVDKTLPRDIMSGSALTRQMSSDGRIAYTLYSDPDSNIAFVHILPLSGDFIGARCIDLPVGKSTALLRYYTLALSSDGSTLYAANSALGVVVAINVSNGNEVFYDKISLTRHFNPGNPVAGSTMQQSLYNGAALSADQKTLYVAGADGIWAIRTSDLSTRGHYLPQKAVTSIAFGSNGRTLYAANPASGITLLDTGTGQTGQVIQGPAHIPWGIAWINN